MTLAPTLRSVDHRCEPPLARCLTPSALSGFQPATTPHQQHQARPLIAVMPSTRPTAGVGDLLVGHLVRDAEYHLAGGTTVTPTTTTTATATPEPLPTPPPPPGASTPAGATDTHEPGSSDERADKQTRRPRPPRCGSARLTGTDATPRAWSSTHSPLDPTPRPSTTAPTSAPTRSATGSPAGTAAGSSAGRSTASPRARSSSATDRAHGRAARHSTTRGDTPHSNPVVPSDSGDEVAVSVRAGSLRAGEVHGQDGGFNEQILFTAEQAGQALAIPGSWLRDKAAAGEVPCRRLGKHLRFARADLEQIAATAARPARNAGPSTTRQPSPPPSSRTSTWTSSWASQPRARGPRKRPSH